MMGPKCFSVLDYAQKAVKALVPRHCVIQDEHSLLWQLSEDAGCFLCTFRG